MKKKIEEKGYHLWNHNNPTHMSQIDDMIYLANQTSNLDRS